MEKMTYSMALANAISVVTDEVTREKLEALKASLEKKAQNKKPNAVQTENEKLKSVILEVMEQFEDGATCTAISKADDRLRDLSIPKMSALMKQLVAEGSVDRKADKKSTLFTLVRA